MRLGKYTIKLESTPSAVAFAAIGAGMEAKGPLADGFDYLSEDAYFGQKTWEKAESRMQNMAVSKALEKASLTVSDMDYVFAGDLLNQSISSTYGLRDLGVPLIGVFGACSTMAQTLGLASVFVDTGAARKCLAVTSSHFCTAERQFRYPLEYAGQRAPTAQWTSTAAGACVVGPAAQPPYIKAVTFGKIEDLGIKDANNMGAAMAPAAASTLCRYFEDTGTNPANYDMIYTGDLAAVGSDLLYQLMEREGYQLQGKHNDCGLLIYDRETQDVASGASGCGTSAAVLCSMILPRLRKGELRDVLFMATGALMSTTSSQQGESIPSVAHLLYLSSEQGQTVQI